MRDIESNLQQRDVENEIAFWEFLDIEYDKTNRTFYFTAHFTQKPSFPELFRRLISSPIIRKIDDEVYGKGGGRIYKQTWKPRSEIETELGAVNVIYTLIDTKNKLLYIGEAAHLVRRLLQGHNSIKDWDYYRYDVLPEELTKHRVSLERMLIREFACLLENKKDNQVISISDYKLANDKIDGF